MLANCVFVNGKLKIFGRFFNKARAPMDSPCKNFLRQTCKKSGLPSPCKSMHLAILAFFIVRKQILQEFFVTLLQTRAGFNVGFYFSIFSLSILKHS